MNDLLLELFSEEIPARMQKQAIDSLRERVEKGLVAARLEYNKLEAFVTPRRLALRIIGLPNTQPDLKIERKGPKVGAPEKALEGFCRSVGLELDKLEIRSKGKDEFYFAIIEQKGKPTSEALQEIIDSSINNFPWEKSQCWGDFDLKWVRPLRRILCIFGGEIIPVKLGHITASNITEGHRFLSEGEITIDDASVYEEILRDNYVLVDADMRRNWIIRDMAEAASKHNLTVKADEKLLDEVTGLVEWPVCLLGEFDKDFLDLPPEVLVLEMRYHQKYFACLDENAKLSNHFLVVSNMAANDNGEAIIKGNQRVLRARLADGEFYWNQDKKQPLADFKHSLDKMIFHAKLGSMADKSERITSLATFLAVFIPHANLSHVDKAASLAKSDLVSGMVGEFPELQGVMGRYYAIQQGEDSEVADAIRDHYKPMGMSDDVPSSPVAMAVALADKLDSLAGMFAAGEKPTGSKDPFALRRAALGVIRIILNGNLRLSLKLALENAVGKFPKALFKEQSKSDIVSELLTFFADRVKVILRDENIRYDLIDAAMADGEEDDLVRLIAKVKALSGLVDSDDGENLLVAYRRATNILRKEEEKDNKAYDGKVDKDALVEESEKILLINLEKTSEYVNKELTAEKYIDAMTALAGLRGFVDNFFDEVIVNDDDKNIRENRLHLLAKLRGLLDNVADFSHIRLETDN